LNSELRAIASLAEGLLLEVFSTQAQSFRTLGSNCDVQAFDHQSTWHSQWHPNLN
jgi:hypothetical protein